MKAVDLSKSGAFTGVNGPWHYSSLSLFGVGVFLDPGSPYNPVCIGNVHLTPFVNGDGVLFEIDLRGTLLEDTMREVVKRCRQK